MSTPFLDMLARSNSIITDDHGPIGVAELAARGQALADRWLAGGAQPGGWLAGGAQPGDRIGLWLPNGRRYLEALAACSASGFAAVAVNTRWSRAEAETLLARSGARLIHTGDGQGDGDGSAGRLVDQPTIGTTGSADPLRLHSDYPFVVFTTSGTTGRPKMVLHGQRSIADHALDAAGAFGYSRDTPVLIAMPLCGVFGLTSLTAAVVADAAIFLPSTIDPVEMAAIVEREQIVAMNGSDDLFHRMLATDSDLSTIRIGGYARFNTSLDGLVGRAEKRGMILTGLYGMSEVQALYSLRDPSAPAEIRERAGGTVVSPRAEVRVVDDELQLRGPSLFAGYLAEGGASIDVELTAVNFTDDGWFRTGDEAVTEEAVEGRPTFAFRHRMGDVLRLGGFLVAPSEVESVVASFAGVEAAQVVAVDRTTGARPVAFVTGRFGPEKFDEDSVIAHCAARLARYKVPIRVLPIDEFPTVPSANGTKIHMVKLREMATEAVAET